MKKSAEILSEVRSILATDWKTREGQVVPEAEQVRLGNDAVKLSGTVLYADLVDSTDLVQVHHDWFAAEVYKSYLVSACHIVRNNGGTVTAFDGDRVMAVYLGNTKNTSAAKSALQINFITGKINAEIKRSYPNSSYSLRQAIGIDTSELFVARTGIRNSNDLVWVGQAANYAAKICTFADATHSVVITGGVFSRLRQEVKTGGEPKRSMWTKFHWTERGIPIYKSNWTWSF